LSSARASSCPLCTALPASTSTSSRRTPEASEPMISSSRADTVPVAATTRAKASDWGETASTVMLATGAAALGAWAAERSCAKIAAVPPSAIAAATAMAMARRFPVNVLAFMGDNLSVGGLRRIGRGVSAAQSLECGDLAVELVAVRAHLVELRLVPVALGVEDVEVAERAALVAEVGEVAGARERRDAGALRPVGLVGDVEAFVGFAQVEEGRGNRFAITGKRLLAAGALLAHLRLETTPVENRL